MLSYKAIGVFSPIVLYGLSDKIKLPDATVLSRLPMKNKSHEERIGLEMICGDKTNQINQYLLTNGLRELMHVSKTKYIDRVVFIYKILPLTFCHVCTFKYLYVF